MKALNLFVAMALVGCGSGSNYTPSSTMDGSNQISQSQAPLSSFPSGANNFRLSLTDAPIKDIKEVWVNVLHAELWLRKADKSLRLVVAKNLGLVDLLTLRNGVMLPMADVNIPEAVEVYQMRLILDNGNYLVKSDETRRDLQTPSAQQSGIKIHFSKSAVIDQSKNYSLVIDFDAEKSIVLKGNGGCLLKPVLKVAGFTSTPKISDVANETGDTVDNVTDITGGQEPDSNVTDPNSPDQGYDQGDTSSYPIVIEDPDVIGELLP